MRVKEIENQAGTAIPAASGETAPLLYTSVKASPLDVPRLAARVDIPAAGALVTFAGQVRDHDHGRRVRLLEYTAHPSAGDVLARCAAAAATATGIRGIVVCHRIGPLEIGDVALLCVVAADHRQQAFGTCLDLVEEVKRTLPVWKHQAFIDGEDEWVGCA